MRINAPLAPTSIRQIKAGGRKNMCACRICYVEKKEVFAQEWVKLQNSAKKASFAPKQVVLN